MINKDNYEEMLVRYAEGELGAGERAAVEAFLEANEWAREELELFLDAPTLMPCAKEFGGEEELKRSFVVQLPWRAFSAAACVALMVGMGVRLWYSPEIPLPNEGGQVVAEVVEPEWVTSSSVSKVSRVSKISDGSSLSEVVNLPEEVLPQESLSVDVESREEAVTYVEQVDADEFYSLLAMMEPEEQSWLPMDKDALPEVPMEPVQESLLARMEDNAQRIRGIWQHVKNIFSSSTELLLAYNEQEY